jgi:hypothetical protein
LSFEAPVTSESPPAIPPGDVTAGNGYAHAVLPDPYRILGLKLRPFSLGHYLLLQRFGCELLQSPEVLATQARTAADERADLILGVLICSMRHAEFLAFVEQKDFLREVHRWGRRVGVFDVAEKTALFRGYLYSSLREPDYLPLQPGDDSGDWAQNLKLTLTTRMHYTEAEALELPLSQALADYYKLAESEGLVRLISPEERRAGEANAAALAEFEKAKAAAGKGAEPCPG